MRREVWARSLHRRPLPGAGVRARRCGGESPPALPPGGVRRSAEGLARTSGADPGAPQAGRAVPALPRPPAKEAAQSRPLCAGAESSAGGPAEQRPRPAALGPRPRVPTRMVGDAPERTPHRSHGWETSPSLHPLLAASI